MNKYIISVGSNIDAINNIEIVSEILSNKFKLLKQSSILKTTAEGNTNQADFLNTAFLIVTSFEQKELKEELLLIEKNMGRIRTQDKNASRCIDLDISVINGNLCDNDYEQYWFVKKGIDELLLD